LFDPPSGMEPIEGFGVFNRSGEFLKEPLEVLRRQPHIDFGGEIAVAECSTSGA